MIRPATWADVQAAADLGVEALERSPIGEVDRKAIVHVITRGVSAASDFMWVSEIGGKIEGALGAIGCDFHFHRGQMLQVAQFYCRPPARGEGLRMLREMIRWADGRPAIRIISCSVELALDKRIIALFERLGFVQEQVEMIRRRPR